MTRYLVTIIAGALGALLLAGGAVLLWLQPNPAALTIAAAGGVCYCVALLLTARPQL